jgi:uncharacterized membrane protein
MEFDEFNDPVNNQVNYKWGIFYFNTKDTRIIVPKRNRFMGYTLNFANPLAWLVIVLIILIPLYFSLRG